MYFMDDIALLHNENGSIVLIVPKPVMFESVDEFSYFIDSLKTQLHFLLEDVETDSSIDLNYAKEAIKKWENQIKQSLPEN